MTAIEIVAIVKRAGGSVEAVGSERVRVLAPAEVLTNALKADVVEHKPEIIALLRERDSLASHDFTDHGYLCRRCMGVARVAVIDGEIVCTFCVVAEAKRIAREAQI